MADSQIVELLKKTDETREISARGFQAVSRDLAQLQKDVRELRTLLEGLLNWVGREAITRQPVAGAGGDARLTVNFEVHPGSFMAGAEILRKDFECDVVVKNVGTAPPHDFQIEVEFPAMYVDVSRSRQFFLKKRGDFALFRVRESNFATERLLPGRDLKVLTVVYGLTPELYEYLAMREPSVHVDIKAGSQSEQIHVPLAELITLNPDEEHLFQSRVARLPRVGGGV